MTEYFCDRCGNKIERLKYSKKIRDQRLCKECYKNNRHNHRKETIEITGIKDDLKKLTSKMKSEWNKKNIEKVRKSQRKCYEKRMGRKIQRRYNKDKSFEPKIKGAKEHRPLNNSYCFLTFQERQNLFRILVKERGLDAEEAKERIKNLVEEEKRITNLMRQENKPEKEIKQKHQEMIEDLWKY